MSIITRWINRFFDNLKKSQRQDMIDDIYHDDPEFADDLEKIKKSMNNINDLMSKGVKSDPNYMDKLLDYGGSKRDIKEKGDTKQNNA